MAITLHKFPKTPHLLWLSSQPARDDKVMTSAEVEAFLAGPVVVEEKVDGANLGLSFDEHGKLQTQNRGNFLTGRLNGQWQGLVGWLAQREGLLWEHLPKRAVLFGEWCRAKHSIHYTKLPDWFVGFDVLEIEGNRFWSTGKRDALLAEVAMKPVHRIASGCFTLHELREMLSTPSAYHDGRLEGLYLRRENEAHLTGRTKLVRAEFMQSIGEHWSRGNIQSNQTTSSPTG